MTRPARGSGTVEYVVAKGKTVVARRIARYDGGVLVDVRDDGSAGDTADVTLTLTPDDARAARDGALPLSVAFMRGTMKMTGDFGVLLQVLPVTVAPDHNARVLAGVEL